MDVYGTCHCGRCLAAFGEAYPDLEYPTGFEHDNHAVLTELNGRYLRTLAGRYARLVGEEPAQFARYFAQALARGARPSAVVIGRPATEHFSAFERSTPVLEIYRGNRDLYADLRPCAPVAVVRPPGGTAMASMQYRSDFTEYRGVFESLQRRHIPFDVLGAEYAPELAGTLSRYAVIVVPGDAVTTPALAAALHAFAEAGGELVVTGGAHLAGVSLGGMVAARAAARHPDRVWTLTIICSAPALPRDPWLDRARIARRRAGHHP